jgi:hypothetical protein
MPQHPHIEDLAYATSSGLLAEEVVFAVGDVLRGGTLDSEPRKALETGKAVLEALVSPDLAVPAQPGMSQLAANEEALDALQAALVQAPDQDVQAYLRCLIGVLEEAIGGADVRDRQSELESLQRLFATFGHITLARANTISRTPQDRLMWPTSNAISAS